MLLEVIRTDATDRSALDLVHGLARLLGKETIEIRDSPGFATSRLGVLLGLEAIRMVEEGVASPEDIDKGMVLGYRYPMGPCRLGDLVGHDVRLGIAEYLHSQLGPRFEPPRLLRKWSQRASSGRKPARGSTHGTSVGWNATAPGVDRTDQPEKMNALDQALR